ncbi:MAG: hypothetical protein QNL04_08790 [SAR324 cluster bacterium]|nr:hypothetical protein [SAR324 cluster bacterium]
MKTLLTLFCLSLFAATPLMAGDMNMSGHKMAGMPPHAGMKGMSDHENMTPSKLGKYKKTEFESKRKHFLVHAPLVPMSNGWGQFEITITDKIGGPINFAKIGHATFEMPGMKMDVTQVKVTHIKGNKWKLGLPIQMPGFWKIKLPITAGTIEDTVYIKFVSK